MELNYICQTSDHFLAFVRRLHILDSLLIINGYKTPHSVFCSQNMKTLFPSEEKKCNTFTASDNDQIQGHKVVQSTINIKSYTTWGKFYTKDLINFQTLSVILTCRDTDNNISDNLPLQSFGLVEGRSFHFIGYISSSAFTFPFYCWGLFFCLAMNSHQTFSSLWQQNSLRYNTGDWTVMIHVPMNESGLNIIK